MSLFESIRKAIFHNPMARSSPDAARSGTPRPAAPATTSRPQATSSATSGSTAATQPARAPGGAAPSGATAAPQPAAVDIEEVLEGLNAKSPQKLNWQTSIVDLMKLVGLDSSLKHRQELAVELGYTGDKNDSAAMNIWLHKAVMRKLAENGGKVPATLQ
jgi:hypothetical protein